MDRRTQKFWLSSVLSLCFVLLFSFVSMGAEIQALQTRDEGVFELKVIRFVSDGRSFREASTDIALKVPALFKAPANLEDKTTTATATQVQVLSSNIPTPTYFHVWPRAASTVIPEEQIYWYHRPTDTIYAAVASAVPTWPVSLLPASGVPYHQGQTARLNNVTILPNETMRHRLHMGLTPKANTFNLQFLSGGTSIFMFMGNSANHVGFVHFYPLWKLSSLNPNVMPTGSITFIDTSGVQTSQQIRFYPGTIYAAEWVYVP
jgi:hypothetical protein